MGDVFVQKEVRIISPIDGSKITTHAQLREHNKRNNVVNTGEFGANNGQDYFDRKAKERSEVHSNPRAKRERQQDVANAYNKEQ